MASIFADVEVGPKIEVFALNKAYQEDTSPVKVSLGVGGKYCYQDKGDKQFMCAFRSQLTI